MGGEMVFHCKACHKAMKSKYVRVPGDEQGYCKECFLKVLREED